jgi:hypothetical protein
LAGEDPQAFYFEAITARHRQPTDSANLSDCFWSQAVPAKVIKAVRETCLASSKEELKISSNLIFVPKNQVKRLGDEPVLMKLYFLCGKPK